MEQYFNRIRKLSLSSDLNLRIRFMLQVSTKCISNVSFVRLPSYCNATIYNNTVVKLALGSCVTASLIDYWSRALILRVLCAGRAGPACCWVAAPQDGTAGRAQDHYRGALCTISARSVGPLQRCAVYH